MMLFSIIIMGINLLLTFLASTKCNNNTLSVTGKTAVIDGLYVLYQKLIGRYKYLNLIKNNDGVDITHIDIFLHYTSNLLEQGIRPIFVFDNINNKNKIYKKIIINNTNSVSDCLVINDMNDITVDVLEDDELENNNITDKLLDENKKNIIDKKKYYNNISRTQITESINFLKNLGVSVINSIGEADQDCVNISNILSHTSCGVVSNDSDMLLYNCNSMINISFAEKKTNTSYTSFTTNNVLEFLNNKSMIYRQSKNLPHIKFTHDNLLDFSIMLGSDHRTYDKLISGICIKNKLNKYVRCSIKHVEHLFEIFSLKNFSVEDTLSEIYDIVFDYEKDTQYSYKIPTDYLELWNKTKDYYKNPIYTEINNNDINDYGYIDIPNLIKYFGNIDSYYSDIVIEKILNVYRGHIIFKTISKPKVNFDSFSSYRNKYFNNIVDKTKTKEFVINDSKLRTSLTKLLK